MSDLAAALQVAIRTHAGRTDKQHRPELLYVLEVLDGVEPHERVVAALHDVPEVRGRGLTKDECVTIGLSLSERISVGLLTRAPGETYAAYIEKIKLAPPGRAGDVARKVKLRDLRVNLGRIPPEPQAGSEDAPSEEWRLYDEWTIAWSGLKRRYEKAIATLESAERTHA